MNFYDNLTVSKIVMITGGAGARKDFVGGWLGLCNGFVRTPWRIDPLIGYSRIDTGSLWDVPLLLDSISNGGICLDPLAKQTLALTCHVDDGVSTSSDNIKKLTDLVDQGLLTIAGIDLDQADMIQYHWDRLVKVYMCLGMEYNQQYRKYVAGLASSLFQTPQKVSDSYAVDYINNRINIVIDQQRLPPRNQDNHWPAYKKLAPTSSIDLDYAELFKPGGSYYLCSALNVSAEDRAHKYWDVMLPFINSPDSCHAFGQEWTKSMIVK